MIPRAAAGPDPAWLLRRKPPERGERTLASYLLLPRPKDAVKWWILPVVFMLGAVSAGTLNQTQLLRAGVVWFSLEFLIYQARYQWNDIAGFEADQRHPDCAARGRLPGPPTRARERKLVSASVAVMRLLAAAVIGLAVPALHVELTNLVLIGAVFGVAAVYERLKQRATGWAQEAPPRLRPATIGLWLAVGGGYAVRGLAGLSLVVGLADRPELALVAAVAMWAYGISFVTARWIVEALPFARLNHGRLVWSCRPAQRREHLLSLVRWLPEPDVAAAAPGGLRAWRPLNTPTALSAPWNLATIVSGTCAALAGLALAGGIHPRTAVALGAASAVGTILVLRATAATRMAVLLGSAVALVGFELIIGLHRPLQVLAPWLAAVGAQLWFFSQSLDRLTGARADHLVRARRA